MGEAQELGRVHYIDRESKMKIYRLPLDRKFQPDHQDFIWPPQNAQPGGDYGTEQDFDNWMQGHSNLLVHDPALADWMYIPIYWNRYYINNWDKENQAWGGGIEALIEQIDICHKYDMPMFTIAEADVKVLKPRIDWDGVVVFMSSRRGCNGGIDIPLLSASHPTPVSMPDKKWLASFLGNLMTDGVRISMHEELKERSDCRVEHAGSTPEEFTYTMLTSYIALAPRGQGAQSFRMYEAMQLGTVPLYISDIDCRPFKKWIDWEVCSLFIPFTDGISEYLDVVGERKDLLLEMGKRAKKVYDEQVGFGKWCGYVLKELEDL